MIHDVKASKETLNTKCIMFEGTRLECFLGLRMWCVFWCAPTISINPANFQIVWKKVMKNSSLNLISKAWYLHSSEVPATLSTCLRYTMVLTIELAGEISKGVILEFCAGLSMCTHTHARTHACTQTNTQTHVRTHTRTHAHAHARTETHTRAHARTHANTHT